MNSTETNKWTWDDEIQHIAESEAIAEENLDDEVV